MTEEQVNYFRTFGFIQFKDFLDPEEVEMLSEAFNEAMLKGRNGAPPPKPNEPRQQINSSIPPNISFFDLNPDVFYPLLVDERFVDVFRNLLGDDFILPISEGLLHTAGSGWHHDNVAEPPYFTMRAHIYLDYLGPEDGCLNVIPGSHFSEFRESLVENLGRLGVRPEDVPGRYAVVNEPRDVIFLNHKTHHAALSDRPYRRCIHINAIKAKNTESVSEQIEALKNNLQSQYPETRITAAAALKRIGTPEALTVLEAYEKSSLD